MTSFKLIPKLKHNITDLNKLNMVRLQQPPFFRLEIAASRYRPQFRNLQIAINPHTQFRRPLQIMLNGTCQCIICIIDSIITQSISLDFFQQSQSRINTPVFSLKAAFTFFAMSNKKPTGYGKHGRY